MTSLGDPTLFIGILATPLGRILLALLLVGVILLVGKVLLSIAWRVLVIAVVVVIALVLLSFVF